jgi:uncharacterized protein YggE
MFQNLSQKIQENLTIRGLFTAALVMVIVILIARGLFPMHRFGGYPDGAERPSITVSGTGEVFVAPDVANFTGTISADAKTMAAAGKSATDQENKLIAKLTEAGIAKDDIKTVSYNAYPKYENRMVSMPEISCYGGNCPTPVTNSVITGYTVSESLSIKVRNLEKAGDIAKLLADSNLNSINGPDFAIDKPEDAQNEARGKAIDDAKAQAKILSRQLGVKLVEIIDFQASNGNGPIYPMAYAMKSSMDAAGAAPAPSPELPAGQTNIKSTVSITYRIR